MKKVLFIFLTLALISHNSIGQTYYFQNFETGLNGWTATDIDNDTNNWFLDNAVSASPTYGTKSLVSLSYKNQVGLTPNNLVTSPLINLTAVTANNLSLEFDHSVGMAPFFAEHYAVYVTSVNTPSAITASVPVFETIVSASGFLHNVVNLTPFIGKSVYLSFRHFDCFDQNFLIIDNILIRGLLANNAVLQSSALKKFTLINTNNTLSLKVKNLGNNPITSLKVNWNDGTDHISTITTSIAVDEVVTVTHPTPLNYSTVLEKNIAITITEVNGVIDPEPADNSNLKKINTISQNSTKKVLVEEGTGTWCGYCPRGAVAMDYMTTTYPDEFIGVAVHNADPMQLAAYDLGAAFSGYPSMNVDRSEKDIVVDQPTIQSSFDNRRTLSVPLNLSSTSSITDRNIEIKATSTFRTVYANADIRMGVIIIEDNVKGTTTGYNQVNYFAGGTTVVGGYETKPNPVLAANMTYNHVGRALLGGYLGQSQSIPTAITDGQQANYTFNYSVPLTMNLNNIKAILVAIDQSTGEILNANKVVLNSLSSNRNDYVADKISIFPNPAQQQFSVQGIKNGIYNIEIYDMVGKLVQKNNNIEVKNSDIKNNDVHNLTKGSYIVNISTEGVSFSKHLLIN